MPPPPAKEGEGAERNYHPEVSTYRCPNGYEWVDGQWPYLELECLNRRWEPSVLPDCKSEHLQYIQHLCLFDLGPFF